MKTRVTTMHTSRPVEVHDTETKLAKAFEKAIGLPAGSVVVTLDEFDMMQPCKQNSEPHCHYRVTTRYDETKAQESIDKE